MLIYLIQQPLFNFFYFIHIFLYDSCIPLLYPIILNSIYAIYIQKL